MPPKRRHSLSDMSPKRCHSEPLEDRSSEPQSTSADKLKRRRTEPEDEGVPAVPSTPTRSRDNAVSTVSNTELEDHEVSILLGTLTIRVRRQQLRDAFGYFAKFTLEEFPKQFSFTAKNDPEDWSSWWLLPSEGADLDDSRTQPQDMDDSEAKDSLEAHKSLLELICLDLSTLRMSFKARESSFWADIAILLARYEAADSVKFNFDGHLLNAVVENDMLRNDPCSILEIGYSLKREEVFRMAMVEIVRRFHATKTGLGRLSNDLRDSVTANVRELENIVQQIRMNILWTLCCTSDFSSKLASSIILQRLIEDHQEAVFLLEPTNPKVYHALRALRDWNWDKFGSGMVPETFLQLQTHDGIVQSTYDVIYGTKGRVEGADELKEELDVADTFGLDSVLHEGQRLLRETFNYINPFMDDDRCSFLIKPPTTFPWQ